MCNILLKALPHFIRRDVVLQGYEILLDGRLLKTPGQKILILPTKALALAISAEWYECCGVDLFRLYTFERSLACGDFISCEPVF